MWPVGRSIPALVPIPSSPRKRAPASVASAASQVLVAALGAGVDHPAVLEGELDARDRDAAGAGGDREADRAVGRCSSGPVNTSPLGMLRLPSELIQVRPSTLEADVGPLGLDPDPAAALRRSTSRAWRALSSRHAADRVGAVQKQGPVDERGVLALGHAGLLGQRRRRQQRARTSGGQRGLPESAARAGHPGHQRRVDVGQLGGVGGSVDPHQRVDRPASARARSGTARLVALARMAVEVAAPATVGSDARTATRHAPASRRSAPAPAPRPGGRFHQHPLARRHLQAPVAHQRRKRAGSGTGVEVTSWRLQLREMLSDVLAQRLAHELPLGRGGHPVAAEQLLLAGRSRARRSSTTPPAARTAARWLAAGHPRAAGRRPASRRTGAGPQARASRAAAERCPRRRGTR